MSRILTLLYHVWGHRIFSYPIAKICNLSPPVPQLPSSPAPQLPYYPETQQSDMILPCLSAEFAQSRRYAARHRLVSYSGFHSPEEMLASHTSGSIRVVAHAVECKSLLEIEMLATRAIGETTPLSPFADTVSPLRSYSGFHNFCGIVSVVALAIAYESFSKIETGIETQMQLSDRPSSSDELRKSLQELSNIKFALDIPTIVALTDSWKIITFVNNKLCDFFQYAEEIIGKNYRILTCNSQQEKLFKNLWFRIARVKACQKEIKLISTKKKCYCFDTTIVAGGNDERKQGQYLKIGLDSTDLTKRSDRGNRFKSESKSKQAEDALLEASFPIIIHKGRWRSFTKQQDQELTGYAREDIPTIGGGMKKVYDERKELVRADINKLYHHDTRVNEGEYAITSKIGETRIWEFSSDRALGQLPDGRRLAMTMAREIAERKSTESALRQSNERLNFLWETANQLMLHDRPHELLNSLFKKLSDHLGLEIYFNYLVHEEGRSLRLNSYSGVSELKASEIEFLEFGQAVCGTVARELCETVVENAQQSTNPLTELVRSMGITAYVCYPLLGRTQLIGTLSFGTRRRQSFQPDELALMQGVCDSVAIAMERARSIEELNKRVEELTEANRIKDEFLAIVSHELRSPLNAILGWTQLLRNRKLDEATTARALETIERNARLQTKLIEDLLDLSRLIRGTLSLNVGEVQLAAVIETVLDSVGPSAVAKGIQLQSNLDPGLGKISGDAERLQQTIWNLLSNAIKFTPSGGRIEVIAQRCGSQAIIQVSDTGCGLSPEFLPFVFDCFRQADGTTTREQSGLGLGLAIVRHLVELHGGSVCVQSEGVGLGARFTVKLPLASWQSDELIEAIENSSTSTQHSTLNTQQSLLSGLQVLVVDDNADTREFLQAVLAPSGAKVTAVAGAAEALAALEGWRPDVLVSDIGMPDIDGYALIRRVRKLEAERGGYIPAVALTAYVRESDRQEAISAGFQRHLTKPIDPDELVRAIAHLVRQTEQARAGDRLEGALSPIASRCGVTPPLHETAQSEPIPPSDEKAPLILVVEDNRDLLNYLQSLLSSQYRVVVATDGVEGQELAKVMIPDLIVTDQIMPRKSGLDLLRSIRSTPELRSIPVIFLTARTGTQARIESFDAGADDYIAKPFDERELLARVRNLLHARAQEQELAALNRQLEEANQTLLYMASSDSLTQVANRRRFNEYLDAEWRRMGRDRKALSLILCDIDYFKRYNDTYGHLAGDECLQRVAQAIRGVVKRPADLVARYGGEEFVVILPNTKAKGAAHVAEAIRREVGALQIAHVSSAVNQYVTLSLGVACMVPAPTLSPDTLIARADEALYRAKEQGRDRVVCD